MPWPRLETSRCHEHADEDWDGESDEGSNSADTEECAGCKSPAQNEEEQDYADAAIDDDGVDGGACAGVYGRYEFAEGKDAVAGVCEGNAGCGDHAALTHGEAGDDGESEDGEGDGLRENLDSIGGEGLAQIGGDAAVDVDDGVGCDEGKEPAELWRVVSNLQEATMDAGRTKTPEVDVMTIARGAAMFALLHSSER